MSKDEQVRLDDTLNYIERIPDISPYHFELLKRQKGTDHAASRRISLGLRFFSHDPQEAQRRRALRALLLCLDWAEVPGQIDDAKRTFQNKSVIEIDDAIQSFFPLVGVAEKDVAKQAGEYQPAMGASEEQAQGTLHCFGRQAVKSHSRSMGGNCYVAVTIWMYLAGAVSLRWLRRYGGQPNLSLPVWGNWSPPISEPEGIRNIASGCVCRIEKPAHHHGGLHYVLTVAQGRCVGVNNSMDITLAWDVARFGQAPSTVYSQFPLEGYLAAMPAGSFVKTTSSLPSMGETF